MVFACIALSLVIQCNIHLINSCVRQARSFISKCLQRILNIHWPDGIANKGASAGPNMKKEMELAWTHVKKK